MEKLIKKITEWILNYQEKYYAKKYKTALQNVQYSSKNSTTKTHAQAGIKLILNSKTEQNKKKLNEEVKEIVTEEVTEEKVQERPEEVEIQTTFNEDSMDVLCEDADIENEEKEGE